MLCILLHIVIEELSLCEEEDVDCADGMGLDELTLLGTQEFEDGRDHVLNQLVVILLLKQLRTVLHYY